MAAFPPFTEYIPYMYFHTFILSFILSYMHFIFNSERDKEICVRGEYVMGEEVVVLEGGILRGICALCTINIFTLLVTYS